MRNSWYADKNQTKEEDKPLLCVWLQNHALYTSTGFRKNLCNWSSGSCILSWTRESLLLAWSSTNINSPNPVDTNKRTSRIQDRTSILMHVRLALNGCPMMGVCVWQKDCYDRFWFESKQVSAYRWIWLLRLNSSPIRLVSVPWDPRRRCVFTGLTTLMDITQNHIPGCNLSRMAQSFFLVIRNRAMNNFISQAGRRGGRGVEMGVKMEDISG